MSIWLRYLAVVCLVGNGFTVVWNLIALEQTIEIGTLSGNAGLIALNLALALPCVLLAILIAAPARRDVGTGPKIVAALGLVSGAVGVLSTAMLLYARAGELEEGGLTNGLASAVNMLTVERSVQNAFFSACTLALSIWVIASRRSS